MTAAEVARLRKRLGLTQEGLAKELGVHPMTVSRWERGTVNIPEPTARLLRILAASKKGKR
jgi:transcriptional regulator with XRE-family HTH domain